MLGACGGGTFLLLEVVASFESKERLESPLEDRKRDSEAKYQQLVD